MNKGRKIAIAATALALALAGAAGAAHTGMLSIRVGGGGSPEASGIRVHGKWSLVVRDRAGRVVARRRFENALTSDGAQMLTSLMSGQMNGFAVGGHNGGKPGAIGGQAIQLDDGTSPGSRQGCNFLPFGNACRIYHLDGYTCDPGACLPSAADASGTLGESVNGATITLSGSIAPPVATTFTKVETQLKTCNYETEADDCPSEDNEFQGWLTFTSKAITPLTVQAGQSVAVSVKISFS